jgi:hypothetical protein
VITTRPQFRSLTKAVMRRDSKTMMSSRP